ncbi:DNA helicase UvrD [Tenacibaculum sp. M341]|nr:DNA helicase UvrD [Tenacibaculum sp. M341]
MSSTFQIYNASAGSGKTFTLVKEYLKVLLGTNDVFYFQKVLAITFTNKAAGEMKERVLKNLSVISEGSESDIANLIMEETGLDPTKIQQRSQKILDAILQNYAAFSITTIDSFTHRIIKNFAYDLGLTLNFEVEMDAVSLLNEAVDLLISKIGSDKELTNLLIDFSLSKIDEDKSWDISLELKEFSKVLLNENDTKYFRKLRVKTVSDFNELQSKLKKSLKELKERLQQIGEEGLEIINASGVTHKDFYYSLLPKHFISLKDAPLNAKFFDQSKLKERIEEQLFYSKNKSDDIKQSIDAIIPNLLNLYEESEKLYRNLVLSQLVLKSIIPLAVLNNINKELTTLKEDNNIRLNAEFNQLISDNIKGQPTPFIYERIGQRFMHYFIDEMQDTSILQWQNLIPLIDNALSQENSSLLLVGDAKQAIYRWRGGKAEQLIDLSTENHSVFQIEKEVKLLEKNYRSYSEVIQFNNSFFQYVSNFLQNKQYSDLFVEGNQQLENTKKGGVVSLSFLEKEEDKELEKLKYPRKVYEQIKELNKEFQLNEICVLVRKKKDGVAVANYLSEQGVNILSSETLLLKNSNKVTFIIHLLELFLFPGNEEVRFKIAYFLFDHLNINDTNHSFFQQVVKSSFVDFFEVLKKYGVDFNLNKFYELAFYEKVEALIRSFKLIDTSDAYVQFFLDVVLEQQRKGTNIQDFLEFWSTKKEVLSIVSSEESTAVNIMTIHKSKGLEFPVVIFPYDLDIYRQIKPKVWFDDFPESFSQFEELLIDYNKTLSYINERGDEIYQEQREALELDNFNLLYVALTRAVEQLHILTEKKISKTGENTNYYSGIFISYLKKKNLWDDNKLEYFFGKVERVSQREEVISQNISQEKFVSIPWQQHNIVMLSSASKLWNTEQEEAVKYGNLIHELLSKVFYKEDVGKVVLHSKNIGEITEKEADEIQQLILKVVDHEELSQYYIKGVRVLNERGFITKDGSLMIPDRLVIKENKAIIIDYKTGVLNSSHIKQVNRYAEELMEHGYEVGKKMLVYINETVLVQEIS